MNEPLSTLLITSIKASFLFDALGRLEALKEMALKGRPSRKSIEAWLGFRAYRVGGTTWGTMGGRSGRFGVLGFGVLALENLGLFMMRAWNNPVGQENGIILTVSAGYAVNLSAYVTPRVG